MSELIAWGKRAFLLVSQRTEMTKHECSLAVMPSPDCSASLQPWVGEIEEGGSLLWPSLQISFQP